MVTLHLGNVKPWVKSAAQEVADKFGLTNVGGWRAQGSVPNSGHPRGLATDFMIKSKAQGQSIADYMKANAERLNVEYLIWNRQIWKPGGSWRAYSGPSPHTDHVHASYLANPKNKALAGTPVEAPGSSGGGIVGAVKDAAGGIRDVAGGVAQIGEFASMLTKLALPSTQVRIAAGLIGTVLLILGIIIIGREAVKA